MSGALCLLTLLTLAHAAGVQAPADSVIVEPIVREEVEERRAVTGELRAVHRSQVAAEEPGVVLEMPIRDGQRVKKGALLARLDGRRLEIELQRLNAEKSVERSTLDERQAQLEILERDVETYRSLLAKGAATEKELADARTSCVAARARIAHAVARRTSIEAQVELIQERLLDTEIRAPFDGAITRHFTDVGAWLDTGDPVVELLSVDALEAWLAVPAQHVQALSAPGASVTLHVEAVDRTLECRQLRIVPLVDSNARAFSLQADITEPVGALTPGMSVQAWVPTRTRASHLTAPKDAILSNQGGASLFVARGGETGEATRAVLIPVKILFELRDRFVVDSPDLHDGDLAITEGNERLFSGKPVVPRRSPASATPLRDSNR